MKQTNKTLAPADDVAGSLGELTGLVRRIIAALDDSSTEPDERHVVCRRLSRTLFVAPEEPVLDWSAPMPSWGTQDFTVPPLAPSSIAQGDGERLRKAKAKIEKSVGQAKAASDRLAVERRALSKLESNQSTMTLPLPTAVDHANADRLAEKLAGRKGK